MGCAPSIRTASPDRVAEIGAAAVEEGLVLHRGRMVLELRPGDEVDKGTAIESLLLGSEAAVALYAGDDTTDLDAFAALDRLEASGRLAAAVRVGVASAEGPSEVTALADVSVDEDRKLTVHKVTVAGDIGPIVNPSGAENQAEGSVVDGFSTALGLEITFEKGRAEQSNFDRYPLLRMPHAPQVEVHFVDSDFGPTGIGSPPGAAR